MIEMAKLELDAQFCSQSLSLLNKIGSTQTSHGKGQTASKTKPSCPKAIKISRMSSMQKTDFASFGLQILRVL